MRVKLLFVGYVRPGLRRFLMVGFCVFTSGHSVLPVLFGAKIILSQLNCLGTFIEEELTYVEVYFWTSDGAA